MKQKRHHYVPQFYLRNFGNGFYCMDKTNQKVFPTNPQDVAVEAGFYGSAAEDIVTIEEALGNMETRYFSLRQST